MQRYLDYEQIKKNRRNSMIIVILFGIVGFLILYGISNYYEMGTTFTVVSLIISIVMTYITYSMSHITVIASPNSTSTFFKALNFSIINFFSCVFTVIWLPI